MKEFEKEYRQMIQEEMPDLWGRIEAGLKERETGGQGEITEKSARDAEENLTGRKKRKTTVKRQYYIGIAAACLCGAIMIPAAVSLLRAGAFGMGGFSESADSASQAKAGAAEADRNTAAAETAESAADAAAADTGSDNGMIFPADGAENTEHISAEETVESAGAEGGVNTAPAEEIKNAVSEETDGNGMLTENTVSPENGAAGSTDIPDQAVMEHVRVKILEVTDMQYHKIYLVAVVQDDSGWLAEGEELHVLSGLEEEMVVGIKNMTAFKRM